MIYIAHAKWTPFKNNPYKEKGEYGNDWSAFVFSDKWNYYNNAQTKLHTVFVSKPFDRQFERLRDFIDYETTYGRNIILSIPLNLKKAVIQALKAFPKQGVRDDDPHWVVHSTPLDCWHSIKAMNALKASSQLGKTNLFLNEPKDYGDYVMLDTLEGCSELVVSFKQGKSMDSLEDVYTPGLRIYFDAHRIINDGIGTRDGAHILKVQHHLGLDYSVFTISAKDFPERGWKPREFEVASNERFFQYLNNRGEL